MWLKTVTNGVPVARHRPILRENGATASGKLFKHLPGPPGPVFGPKTVSKTRGKKHKNIVNKISDPSLLSAHGDALNSLHDSNQMGTLYIAARARARP